MSARAVGRVRIIGGRWRGRRLDVPDVEGLRPTGDRLRETLFNWLQPEIVGSRCLDLFAGSGALGFEAASRGAIEVTLVEPDRLAAATISRAIETLQASDSVGLERGTANAWLADSTRPYDIVFVDPPFNLACQIDMLRQLATGHLADEALVYVEAPRAQAIESVLPDGLVTARERAFGDVMARLYRYRKKND